MLNVNPEIEHGLNQLAQMRGVTLDALLKEFIVKELPGADALDSQPEPNGSLHEFFMHSPLRGAELDLSRAKDLPRAVEFE